MLLLLVGGTVYAAYSNPAAIEALVQHARTVFLSTYTVENVATSSTTMRTFSGAYQQGSMSSTSCSVPCPAIIAYYLVFGDGSSAFISWQNGGPPQSLTSGQKMTISGSVGSVPAGVIFSQNPPPTFAINNAHFVSSP